MKKEPKLGATFWAMMILTIVFGIYFLLQIRQSWQGFFFPGGCENDTPLCIANRKYSPVFGGKNQCLDWGAGMIKSRNDSDDTFLCTQDCRGNAGGQSCSAVYKGSVDPDGSVKIQ